ncbi:MAG: ribonuclease H-like domain-containing protein [Planctomycetota bacterium]|nr:ribonuclease H-like domain-containing protein [Planctomycetota bacterium]
MKGDQLSRLRRSLRKNAPQEGSRLPTRVPDYDAIVDHQVDPQWIEQTSEDVIFLDLETTGLRPERSLTSLIGILYRQQDSLRLEQWYSGDVADERRQLERLQRFLGRFDRVVTYNGNRFDLPFLRSRCHWHRLGGISAACVSSDLLVDVRRRYRKEWPNCRQTTAEQRLLGLPRCTTDVPGSEAPKRFQDLRGGAPLSVIEPVLLHNRRDLISLVGLRIELLKVTIKA